MNVILLTTGLSGSSVITALIKQAGFWTGDSTVYKDNSSGKYETHENTQLVELNEQLIQQTGYSFGHEAWYDETAIDFFNNAFARHHIPSLKQFIEQEDLHAPWLWKDPKMWITIGYWIHLLDPATTRFVVLTRNTYQLWSSQVEKRTIYDYRYLKNAENASKERLKAFLENNHCQYLELEYDSLISQPQTQIQRLNAFLDTSLTLNHWQSVYRKPAMKKTIKRHLLALPIYLKNYSERIR